VTLSGTIPIIVKSLVEKYERHFEYSFETLSDISIVSEFGEAKIGMIVKRKYLDHFSERLMFLPMAYFRFSIRIFPLTNQKRGNNN